MTVEELNILRAAVATISDPRGNWTHGWKMLCELAEMDAGQYVPPFHERSEEENVPKSCVIALTKRDSVGRPAC